MTALQPQRPVLRYFGGKWLLAPWILSHFPPHRVYVEPFGGAASVLMQKPRSYAEVYNDLDGEIVNLFQVLRDQGSSLEEAIRNTPFARSEFLISYRPSQLPIEQARRTVIRSFMGFGSAAACGAKTGFRANSNRLGTTPARDWANFPPNVAAFSERLRGVVIENGDAKEIMSQHDGADTLHFVDPPYVWETRSKGNPYCKKGGYRFELNDDEHSSLCDFLSTLTGMVILCGYHNPIYDRLGWQTVEKEAHADGARDRTEVLWLNPAVVAAQSQQSLFGGAS